MRGVLALARVELKLFLREPQAVFFSIVFPSAFLVLYRAVFGDEGGGAGRLYSEVPGLIAMMLATMGMMTLPFGMGIEKELGFIRRLRATPLPTWGYAAAWVLVFFGVSAVGLALLLGLGAGFYGLLPRGSGFFLAGAVLWGAVCFLLWGTVLALSFPRARTAGMVGMAAFFPMLFLSGVSFPWEMIPQELRLVAEALPMRPLVVVCDAAWQGGMMPRGEATVLGAWTVVGALAAWYAWKRGVR